MAATLRLTPGRPARQAVIGAGPFGERVAALLAEYDGPTGVGGPGEIEDAFALAPRLVTVAMWRPCPALCETADRLSYRTRRPWLPVVMEHPVVRVGPLIWPPHGPCFSCYRRRREQHDGQYAVTQALLGSYDREPGGGPAGYLPHTARLAAAVAADLAARIDPAAPDDGGAAGEVVTIGLLKQTLHVSQVVACHDCDRCGAPVRGPGLARLTEVAASLAHAPRNLAGAAS
jgi:bacteriocin biosynthesis cyclodehydratase domain-containing protein